jgi:hypothetical protein
MLAAERLRETGGASATEQLLGLHLRPTVMGAFVAPPGNAEALRHMTPVMRRNVLHMLLDKQRARSRRLARLLRDGRRGGDEREQGEPEAPSEALAAVAPDEAQLARAREELLSTVRLLDLLEELLAMQDYTVSQMGTFSQG